VSVESREPGRKLRADGLRNRERLVDAAKAGFAETGPQVSLEEIARRAGVGIGTLYRHFPTRDLMIGAVYQHKVQQLSGAATALLETRPAGQALHEWMGLFVSYIATKKLIAAALSPEGLSNAYAAAGGKTTDSIALLVERARAAGDIRPDVEPGDVLRGLIGLTYGNTDADWEASARRLVNVLMAGMRTAS
jgi:AcrR family transcriptional regulator